MRSDANADEQRSVTELLGRRYRLNRFDTSPQFTTFHQAAM